MAASTNGDMAVKGDWGRGEEEREGESEEESVLIRPEVAGDNFELSRLPSSPGVNCKRNLK